MTGSKIVLAEQKDLGIYKAIGFSSASLRLALALRFAMVAALGGLIGTFLAVVITDPIVSSVMKLAGISNFVSHPNFIGLVLPMVVVMLLFAAFGWLSAGKIKKVPLAVLVTD